MKKLLTLATAFMTVGIIGANAAGPIYTVPAEYEKMKKAMEGLLGKSLTTVNSTQAYNIGSNVRSFVEGATGRSVSSTYSPSYFRAYGGNYRQFVSNAAGTDPGSTTSTANFANAGRNYRELAQGLTGLGITDGRYYYYNYAGNNYRNVAQGLANGQPITTSPTYYSNYQQTKIQQFKQRADQVFYDTYLNPQGLRRAFTTLSSAVTTKTAGLTPITRYNKAEFGGGGLEDTFDVQVSSASVRIKDAKGKTYTYDIGLRWVLSGNPSYANKSPFYFKDSFGNSWKMLFRKTTYSGWLSNHTTCLIYDLYKNSDYIGTINACIKKEYVCDSYGFCSFETRGVSSFSKADSIRVVQKYYNP